MKVLETQIYANYLAQLNDFKGAPDQVGRVARMDLLLEYYECFCFDGFGTFYLRDTVYDDSQYIIEKIRSAGKPIRLVSNTAARTGQELWEDLQTKGLDFGLTEIITSGDMLLDINLKLGLDKAFLFGRKESESVLGQAQIRSVSEDESRVVIVTSHPENAEMGEEWIERASRALSEKDSLLIVLNPDVCAPVLNEPKINVSGAWAHKLSQHNQGKTIYVGKPFPLIYKKAMQSFYPVLGSVLMVGDTLGTDILGATHVGIDSALLLRGNTVADEYAQDIADLGFQPTYVLESL